jgi:hypothetical protein
MNPEVAQRLCRQIKDKAVFENCVLDLTAMGDASVLQAYLRTLKAREAAAANDLLAAVLPFLGGRTFSPEHPRPKSFAGPLATSWHRRLAPDRAGRRRLHSLDRALDYDPQTALRW